MNFREFFAWVRFLALIAVVILFVLYTFGVFDDGSFLYKPCAEVGNDDAMWMECVDYYMKDEGWTYDEILNGVVIQGK